MLGGSGRGDLHYRFVIEMPTRLTPSSATPSTQLSKVMNGNPRERILREAAARAALMAHARATTRITARGRRTTAASS